MKTDYKMEKMSDLEIMILQDMVLMYGYQSRYDGQYREEWERLNAHIPKDNQKDYWKTVHGITV